jgi:hypothetical protein
MITVIAFALNSFRLEVLKSPAFMIPFKQNV